MRSLMKIAINKKHNCLLCFTKTREATKKLVFFTKTREVTKKLVFFTKTREATKKLVFPLGISFFLLHCQSSHIKKLNVLDSMDLPAQSIKSSISNYEYTTQSRFRISTNGKMTKKYTKKAQFNIQRRTLQVSPKGEMQFRITTSDKKGNMDLKDLALPEPGEELYEMVNKFGQPLVVKDYPVGSIFYIPRISLPKTKIKVGDEWIYKGRWISKNTGWPFEMSLKSKLKSWSDCNGVLCAIVTFTGAVSLPKDFPIRGFLKSEIEGEYHYTPFSFDVLWGKSSSVEVFELKSEKLAKKIKLKSKSCSRKLDYFKQCRL